MSPGEKHSYQGLRLGIGVVTYNRCSRVLSTIDAIRRYTETEYVLVVADDGSPDGTCACLEEAQVSFVTGLNRGIAWNKNRALFFLDVYQRCDIIILIEDDTVPTEPGWEKEWIRATIRWGHINFAVPWRSEHWFGGAGTAEDPILADYVTGQASAFSAEALGMVGYLDTRFKTYGYEHVEHTKRMLSLGYGGVSSPRAFYLLKAAMRVDAERSHGTAQFVAENAQIAMDIAQEEQSFGAPWRKEAEWRVLRAEMEATMIREGVRESFSNQSD